jgi:alpha-L-fucosidase
MDLNSAKYPSEALFYSDIKSYEQNAGQQISKENNKLPALSCLPINSSWFWKESFPADKVKDPAMLIKNDIIPFNNAYCNFILNVAPNRDGLIDDNALQALKQIGEQWKNNGSFAELPLQKPPVISHNIAKKQPVNASWSDDMWIMDFGNDDDFTTAWLSNKTVSNPWYEVDFGKEMPFNTVVITETANNIIQYRLEYFKDNRWMPLLSGDDASKIKIHRFNGVWGEKMRILIDKFNQQPGIAELGVYDERR